MRRALAMDKNGFGPDHPDVGRDLNDLAQLLQAANRLAEAEPLLKALERHGAVETPELALRRADSPARSRRAHPEA